MRYARLHENLVAASKLLRDFFALKPTVKPVVVAVIACIRFFIRKLYFRIMFVAFSTNGDHNSLFDSLLPGALGYIQAYIWRLLLSSTRSTIPTAAHEHRIIGRYRKR